MIMFSVQSVHLKSLCDVQVLSSCSGPAFYCQMHHSWLILYLVQQDEGSSAALIHNAVAFHNLCISRQHRSSCLCIS